MSPATGRPNGRPRNHLKSGWKKIGNIDLSFTPEEEQAILNEGLPENPSARMLRGLDRINEIRISQNKLPFPRKTPATLLRKVVQQFDTLNDETLIEKLEQIHVDEPENSRFSHRYIHRLAQRGVPDAEIAKLLRIDVALLKKEAHEALELGRTIGTTILRVKQFGQAMKGDQRMLVWLGKQALGQVEKVTNEISGPGGQPIEMRQAVVNIRGKLEDLIQRHSSNPSLAPTSLQEVLAQAKAKPLLPSGD